ncbi:hypothetical protein DCG74_09710 [Bradyrhizobium sp. WBAH42]|nr:hypothetical protein [Bradyrhizobium sp. WBAH30]MDD1544191.1 hypothetical protein [Bradyrhizobium sp. WBAH41]MDD1560825.1 hypothetical protein [Bradyrhizobium sp. WBAH23]MDD1566584.1 hypothetical protein [Bradyrhizobium sp. WBAH33]MDD1587479.1 hypothetical protein [Bradyrhizobium sp. WBAH42]NRB89149.1 hypothetical protein [Bradyrhizobium sp. WBAH10]QCJ87385.1 hypothetical protein DAA57_01830 [Bradyrhizobium yuanmingense]
MVAGIWIGSRLYGTINDEMFRKTVLALGESISIALARLLLLAMSAKSALEACQPYKMLPAENYEEWKVLDLSFPPRERVVELLSALAFGRKSGSCSPCLPCVK